MLNLNLIAATSALSPSRILLPIRNAIIWKRWPIPSMVSVPEAAGQNSMRMMMAQSSFMPIRKMVKSITGLSMARNKMIMISIMGAIIAAPEREASTILCRLVPPADLNEGEKEELVKFAGKRFGSVAAARKMLNEAFKKYRRKKAKEQKEKQKTTFAFGEMPIPESHKDTKLNDFIAYMPTHEYYYVPTRDMWPGGSVNSQIPGIAIGDDEEISPSHWLDQHRHIEQMTWNPGFPMIIKNRLIKDGGSWI